MTGIERYKKLLDIAKKSGYNITELANEIGLSHNTLKNGIENEIIQLKYLKKIVRILNLDPAFFFEEEYHRKEMFNIVNEHAPPYYKKGYIDEMIEQMKMMRNIIEDYQRKNKEK